ncbi:MAG: hypothetical protein F6K31_13115 [Symploca sp. SIO2G7]|nr:hypothetical protein [Symploca sp. SIO2G7]
MVAKWDVFFLHNCRYTQPSPKNKLIVIAYIEPSPHGFLINSKINDYLKNNPRLLPCEALISSSQHSFLKYDSYVDCRDIFAFLEGELVNPRGSISEKAKQTIITAARHCPVLENIHKKRILNL